MSGGVAPVTGDQKVFVIFQQKIAILGLFGSHFASFFSDLEELICEDLDASWRIKLPSSFSPPYLKVKSKIRFNICIFGLKFLSHLADGGAEPVSSSDGWATVVKIIIQYVFLAQIYSNAVVVHKNIALQN